MKSNFNRDPVPQQDHTTNNPHAGPSPEGGVSGGPHTPIQIAELDRRREAHRAGLSKSFTWAEVKNRLVKKH